MEREEEMERRGKTAKQFFSGFHFKDNLLLLVVFLGCCLLLCVCYDILGDGIRDLSYNAWVNNTYCFVLLVGAPICFLCLTSF